MNPEAVLLIAQVVVSLFNVQLGNPVYSPYPFPKMEICEYYADLMQGTAKLDMEYMLITRAECVTVDEFVKMGGALPAIGVKPAEKSPNE